MAKKRKTLPKDFNELLEKSELDQLKSIFEKCEINARGGYSKQTALAFDKCPHELALWLVENGADLEATDTRGNTALHNRSRSIYGNIKSLLSMSPEIDSTSSSIGTPLHAAADSHNAKNVSLLIEHGADVNIKNSQGLTPLEQALRTCSNIDIPATLEISKLIINSGVTTNEKMSKFVQDIGENFEFHKENFDKDSLPQVESALSELYNTFNVKPVLSRKMHDGKSPIIASSNKWQSQHKELWEYLVPSSGACTTVQGEVIRISGRIANELEGNGGINWDSDFKRMADAFLDFIQQGNSISEEDLPEINQLVKDIKVKRGDANFMAQVAVEWVIQNPDPINLKSTNYKR